MGGGGGTAIKCKFTLTLHRPGSRRCEVVYFCNGTRLGKVVVEEFVSADICFMSPSGASSKPAVRGVQSGSEKLVQGPLLSIAAQKKFMSGSSSSSVPRMSEKCRYSVSA